LSASPKLTKQIELELAQLDMLLQRHKTLFDRCRDHPPTEIERAALAALLHAFYTGIENIFKRIALERNGAVPVGDLWHSDLLRAMAEPSAGAVIPEDLRVALREYLDFRHVFRHAYTFDLRWEKMAGLVLNCHSVFQRFRMQMENFISRA